MEIHGLPENLAPSYKEFSFLFEMFTEVNDSDLEQASFIVMIPVKILSIFAS
jgi:hypothetical protein